MFCLIKYSGQSDSPFLLQFQLHAAAHYAAVCDLISADIKMELRVMLRKFFSRLGLVYEIIPSAVTVAADT